MGNSNKEIKISASLDAQMFEQQLERVQQKLNKINQPQQTVDTYRQAQSKMTQQGFTFDKQAEERYKQQSNATKRELDDFIKKSNSNMETLDKLMDRQKLKLESLLEFKKKITEEDAKQMGLNKQIAEQQSKLTSTNARRDATAIGLNEALDQRGAMNTKFTGIMPEAGIGSMGASIIGGLAAIGPLMSKFDTFMRANVVDRKQALWSAQGSAATGLAGGAQNIYSGQMQKDEFFSDERTRALQEATSQYQGSKMMDYTKAGAMGTMLAGGLGTAGAMAATGVGAPLGIATALGTAGYGGYQMATDPKMFSMMFDQERYKAMNAQEFGENYQQNFQSQKNKDPLASMAMDKYMGNLDNNLAAQRRLGYGDKDFFFGKDSYLGKGNEAGFRESDLMGATAGIMGSGGSTRMGRNGGVAALKMSRDLDMTNASSMLGRISSNMGAQEESEHTMVRVMAESVRLGLDSSKFSEEQRQFAQSVTELVVGAQAGNAKEAGSIASMASDFFDPNSMRGIQEGAGLFQFRQGLTSETEGVRGAIQASALEKDKVLGKMSTEDRSYFSELEGQHVNVNNKNMQNLASKYYDKNSGQSEQEFLEDFVNRGQKVKNTTTYNKKETDVKADELAKLFQERFKGKDNISPEERQAFFDEKEISQKMTGLKSSAQFGDKYKGFVNKDETYSQLLEADIIGRSGLTKKTSGAQDVDSLIAEKKEKDKFQGFPYAMGEDRTRIGDTTVTGQARQESVVRGEFERNYDRISKSANETANMSEEMMKATLQFTKAFKDNGDKVNDAMLKFAENVVNATSRMNSGNTNYVERPTISGVKGLSAGIGEN